MANLNLLSRSILLAVLTLFYVTAIIFSIRALIITYPGNALSVVFILIIIALQPLAIRIFIKEAKKSYKDLMRLKCGIYFHNSLAEIAKTGTVPVVTLKPFDAHIGMSASFLFSAEREKHQDH